MVGYLAVAVSLIWNHARVAPSYRERNMTTLIFIASSFSLIAALIVTTIIPSSPRT